MSDSRPDLSRLVGELARTVDELQSELEPQSRPPLRPPTPRELTRFTSEVTIPALILVLETNVRALKLLQRTLRLATGVESGRSGSNARERAEALGQRTVQRLDDVLEDLQDALEGRPPDERSRQLLKEARTLGRELETRLSETDRSSVQPTEGGFEDPGPGEVDIDVESELQSIRDDLDDENGSGANDRDGSSTGRD